MKNRFIRFVVAVFLSAMGGIALASRNPILSNPAGSNQNLCDVTGVSEVRQVVDKSGKVIGGAVARGPVCDKSGKMTSRVLSDGSVSDNTKSIGRMDSNRNLIPNQQLVNMKVLETVAEYRSKTGACNLVQKGVKGVEESIGVYDDNSSNFSLNDRARGDNSSVVFSQRLKVGGAELVALIHNHPGEGQNPWPSVADVQSAIKTGKDVYIVDCSENGAVLRVNHETGAVTKITSNGNEQSVNWKDFKEKGIPIYKEEFAKQNKKSASKLCGNDLYDPSRFAEIAQSVDVNECDSDEIKGAKVGSLADNEINVEIPDLSKLIDLVMLRVELLRKFSAMNREPSEEDYANINSLNEKIRIEIKAIEGAIARMDLTEEEKIKIGEDLGKQVNEKIIIPYSDTINSLERQIATKWHAYIDKSANIDLKYLK